jgi:hypothetical protein
MLRRLIVNIVAITFVVVVWSIVEQRPVSATNCCNIFDGDSDCASFSDRHYTCQFANEEDSANCTTEPWLEACYNLEGRHCVGLYDGCVAQDDCCWANSYCNGDYYCTIDYNDPPAGCLDEWSDCSDNNDCCSGLVCNGDWQCVNDF